MLPFADAIAKAAEEAPTQPTYPDKVAGLVVHIDGDYLAYHASGNDDCQPGMARLNAQAAIDRYMLLTGATSAVVHSTASGCHKGERYLVATVKPYQGQRDTGRKPKNYAYLRDFLLNYSGDAFRSKVWATREADDGFGAVAYYAQGNKAQGGYAALATADKDMRMLPGLHVDWKEHTTVMVPEGAYEVWGPNGKLYGLKWFWMQMLMGDAADNCPGLELAWNGTKMVKVGEKTAEKFLADCEDNETAYRRVVRLYRRGYDSVAVGSDRFVEQAGLMWMRTGPKANVLDFAEHNRGGGFSQYFDPAMWDACERLDKRVKEQRAMLEEIGA